MTKQHKHLKKLFRNPVRKYDFTDAQQEIQPIDSLVRPGMLVNIPQRARLAARHSGAACLDLTADGLSRSFRNNPGLIITQLLIFACEQLPHAWYDVA